MHELDVLYKAQLGEAVTEMYFFSGEHQAYLQSHRQESYQESESPIATHCSQVHVIDVATYDGEALLLHSVF